MRAARGQLCGGWRKIAALGATAGLPLAAFGLLIAKAGLAVPVESEAVAPRASTVPEHEAAVTWTRGSDAELCPTQAQFRAELVALGAPTFSGDVPTVAVTVERDAAGWSAEIRAITGDGRAIQRQLRSGGEHCDGIFAAAALDVLLVLEGDAAPTPSTARAEPPGAVHLPPVVELPLAPPPLDHSFELGAILARGVLPHLAFGGAARYALPLSARVSLTLRGLLLPEQHVRHDEGGLGLSLWALGVGVSHRFWHGETSSLLGSVEFQFGRLQVDVEAPLRAGQSALFWPCTSVALRGEQRLGSPLFLAADMSLGVPLGPLRLGVEGGPLLAEVDPVTISVLVSLGVNFH